MDRVKEFDMALFGEVAQLVDGRFVPSLENAPAKRDTQVITLYSALMERFGFGYQDSVWSARNHNQVRQAMKWFYAVLDDITGTRSQPWAMHPDRTENEVLGALEDAQRRHPVTDFDDLTAELRIGVNKIAGRGKIRGALACEAARVAFVRDVDFAAVIGQLSKLGQTDERVLSDLEPVPGAPDTKAINWEVASKWSVGYNDYASLDPTDLTMGGFCRWLFNDWSEISDTHLLERLAHTSGGQS